MNCYEYEACEYNAQPRCCLPDGQGCPHGVERQRPTNADRIRAMSDEELAGYILSDLPIYRTYKRMLEWLQQPAPEEEEQV